MAKETVVELYALKGSCVSIKKANALAEAVAEYPIKVLLTGPTGSGKSRLARYIHAMSKRKYAAIPKERWRGLTSKSLKAMIAWAQGRDNKEVQDAEEDGDVIRAFDKIKDAEIKPFVAADGFLEVNLAALSQSTVESELFGYVYGAFTGARRKGYPGLLISANGGTLFIDEIAECPLPVQAKLLTVIQPRGDEESKGLMSPCYVTPIGQSESIVVDVRLIFATNKDLKEEVLNGRFREDLYHRISGSVINLPSLMEIRECPGGEKDFEVFVNSVVEEKNYELFGNDEDRWRNLDGGFIDQFGQGQIGGTLEELKRCDFHGNYRQLQNVVSNAMVASLVRNKFMNKSKDDKLITVDDLKGLLGNGDLEGSRGLIAGMCGESNQDDILANIEEWVAAAWIDVGDIKALSTIVDVHLDVQPEVRHGRTKGGHNPRQMESRVCDAAALRDLCYLIKLLKDHYGDKEWNRKRYAQQVVGRSEQALATLLDKFGLTFEKVKAAICR